MKLAIVCMAAGAFPWTVCAQDKVNQGSLVLQEFAQRVAAYMNLHRAAAAHIPGLKPTKTVAELERHERALAHHIREAREGATQGNIFTPEIAAQFRVLIGETMKGPPAVRIRDSLKQAEPVWLSKLQVNAVYPHAVPLQSSPPTLLMNLPQLPSQLEYRFVSHSLILRDLEANLIVDFIRDAIQ
ncbi:MAG: hypothetical protein ABI806_08025 [Candidatus Solibacter sp.]